MMLINEELMMLVNDEVTAAYDDKYWRNKLCL